MSETTTRAKVRKPAQLTDHVDIQAVRNGRQVTERVPAEIHGSLAIVWVPAEKQINITNIETGGAVLFNLPSYDDAVKAVAELAPLTNWAKVPTLNKRSRNLLRFSVRIIAEKYGAEA